MYIIILYVLLLAKFGTSVSKYLYFRPQNPIFEEKHSLRKIRFLLFSALYWEWDLAKLKFSAIDKIFSALEKIFSALDNIFEILSLRKPKYFFISSWILVRVFALVPEGFLIALLA